MKAKKEPNEIPRYASGLRRISSFLIDLGILYLIVVLTFKYFQINNIFPMSSISQRYLYVVSYYYLILTILTQTIFSQTIGQFIFGIKVVSEEKLQRLSFFRSLCGALFLRFLSKSVVVKIR